jgi:hypothetical protein
MKHVTTTVAKPIKTSVPLLKPAGAKTTGRPSKRSEKVADAICEGIAQGKSLVTILKKKGMPSYTRVMVWLQEDEEFRDRYARARADQSDYLADEILAIADATTTAKDSVAVQAARLQIDSRKWIAAKLKPQKYSERMTHVGDDGSPIAMKSLVVSFVEP